MVKRKKKETENVSAEISSDIQGFTNYFTAPNIRNKVKHPVFLAYKFNKCVSIFYNQDYYNSYDRI